jgi:hypothetical protein
VLCWGFSLGVTREKDGFLRAEEGVAVAPRTESEQDLHLLEKGVVEWGRGSRPTF